MDTSRCLSEEPDAVAPDTMEVRLLARGATGSMAHFRLPPNRSGRAVVHADLEELWYCLAGEGLMWLSKELEHTDPPMSVRHGTSFVIPKGCAFQLKNTGQEPIDFVGVTMPPWPGNHAVAFVDGPFNRPSVGESGDSISLR